ncbi:chromosome partitioning protein [Brachybacterium sp. UMB0905]|nr:chromosome partitioning protein [Brachybacterium sp. UMB0905]
MIAQARITSDTSATVHLEKEAVEVTGVDLAQVRDRVKQVFITAAKLDGQNLDVVIVEPDVRHHLRVEPSGRITGREADDREVWGPDMDAPLVPPMGDDTAELQGLRAALASPATGELPTVRSHRARRRRAALPPQTSADAERADSAATGEHPALVISSGQVAPMPRGAHSAASGATASSAPTASSASPAPSADSAPSAGSAPTASSAPSAPSAPSSPTAPSAPSAASASEPPRRRTTPVREKKPLAPRTVPGADGRPTLQDLQSSTRKNRRLKATKGLPGLITKLTGGVISPRPGKKERFEIERLERIRRPLDGPKNIAVVNLKGGAHKTTASLMIAATLGVVRGGSVLAWDNNETRGTLGWRGLPTEHHRTVVDLLHDMDALHAGGASNSDLDPYVRPQGEMRFDILASDEDPGSMASIDAEAFQELDDTLSRFYRIKVIDTGNNVRASNWLAAVESADQLVIISTVREDTFNAAAWMIDELRATGLAEQVDNAVTILSHSSKGKFDPKLRSRLMAHFGAHTRAVTEVPYEQQFVDGSHLDWPQVSDATKNAWMNATALIIDGL